MCTPVEAAEDVKAPVLSAVEVHAEDGGEDEQHHGEVKHHHHRGLQGAHKTQGSRTEKRLRIWLQDVAFGKNKLNII